METCTGRREEIMAYAYDELSDEQKTDLEVHMGECGACQALLKQEQELRTLIGDCLPLQPSESLIRQCREALRWRLMGTQHKRVLRWLWRPIPSWGIPWGLQIAGALTVLLIGFLLGYGRSFSRRIAVHAPPQEIRKAAYTPSEVARHFTMNEEPEILSLQFLEYDPEREEVALQVRATSDLTVKGRPDDEPIQRILTWAIRQNVNAGARIESIEMLGRWMDHEIRDALVEALENDENPGVRLQAIEALKGLVGDEEVKQAFLKVLKEDPNPGIRIQAIEALGSPASKVPRSAFEQAAEEDQNNYVRILARKALLTTDE